MSVIPEYRGRPTEERPEKPKRSGLRTAMGILAIISGIFLFLGFLGGVMGYASLGGIMFRLTYEIPELPSGIVILAIDLFVAAVIALIMGIVALVTGIRSWSRSPAGVIRGGLILWSLLLTLYIILILASAISLEDYMEGVSLAFIAVALVGAVLTLIGGILVKPRSSFASWMAGSILVLVGIILLLISVIVDSGIESVEPGTGGLNTLEEGLVRSIEGLYQIHILLNPFLLITMLIGAVALIIAPFLGARNLWVVALIGVIAGMIASIIVVYYSATSIDDAWRHLKMLLEHGSELEGSDKIIVGMFIVGNFISAIGYLLGAILGLVALILTIIYISMKRAELFAQGQQTTSSPPSSQPPSHVVIRPQTV